VVLPPRRRQGEQARPLGAGSFDRWWRRCLVEASVRYRNPHVARHTFATRWLRRGGRLETLSIAMGHASIRTTSTCTGTWTRLMWPPTWRLWTGPCEMNPHRRPQNTCKGGRRGADRIRTGVRGFAGLCLTSRPPRRRACHRSGRKVALGRKRLPCAEWTHAASCEPCPGVDGARCGWSPGPLPGLRYGYEERANPDYAVPGASRRPARRRAVARVRRSARRPAARSAASSPLRARRRRSKCRSRS